MKAIFIPDSGLNIDKLNQDLKDCIEVLQTLSIASGIILLCSNYSRKDKLENINKSLHK